MLKQKTSNPNNKVIGCKVESQIKPKMTVNETRQLGHTESDQQDFFMASKQNPSQTLTPNRIKKKKKKKCKKSLQKSKTEIQKSGHKTKKSISQVIPWGVNQQRLRNYILAEQEKYYNAIQRRNIRITVDLKERRQQMGTSFLNQFSEKNLKSISKKKKSFHEDNPLKQKYKIPTTLQQQYKQLLQKPKNLNIIPNRLKISSIHYSSPAQKIQKRNRSLSQGQHNKPIQNNRNRTGSLHEKTSSLFEATTQKLKFKKQQNQKKIVIQYQNIDENFIKINQRGFNSQKNESKPQSSLYKLMSNSSSNNIPNDSDGEQNIQDIDNGFYSQKNILDTHSEEEEEEVKIKENNIFQMKNCSITEIENDENYFKKENNQKIALPQNILSVENYAALIIQKMWKGYKIRQMIFKSKFQKKKTYKTKNGLNLKSLTKSQINKLIKFGFFKKDSIDNSQIVDESSFLSHSRPNSQLDNQKEVKKQIEPNQYQKFIENFQDGIDCQSNKYNNQNQDQNKFREIQLQIISDYTPEKIKKSYQNSQDEKSRKVSKLSIDVEEQEEENKVDIGEIRCAFGSESLLKSLSQEGDQQFQQDKGLFESTTFQDFVMNKFKELMQRDKMDQLIALREETVQQRQQQTLKQIDKAFKNNQISPRTFEVQQKKIEKWVNKQKVDLEQKKREIQKGQQSVFDAIVKTQRDLQFVRQMLSSQNSQTFLKIVDSLSQESANYSQNSLKSSILDIQISNSQMLQQSQQEDKNKVYEDIVIIQRKSNNILEEKELICPEPFNLKKLAQSQFVRNVEQQKEPQKISEKCADSYSILISNMLIQDEVSSFYIEMQRNGIDLYEIISNSQLNRRNQIAQPKEQKIQGIKTNVAQIKLYLKNLEQYLIDNVMIQILRLLNVPLGPSSKLMLKFLQPIRDSSNSEYDFYGTNHQCILNVELFGKFERFLLEQRIINHQNKLIIELEHIHNKAIFDSLNEALDHFRPYALNGQPFLWNSDPTRLKLRENQLTDIPYIIRKAAEKVIDWSHYMTGILVDKEDSLFPKVMQLDQETLRQIREDRLYRMLTLDIIDNEEKWTNYDDEITEISIDLSDLIFDYLIKEVAFEIYQK